MPTVEGYEAFQTRFMEWKRAVVPSHDSPFGKKFVKIPKIIKHIMTAKRFLQRYRGDPTDEFAYSSFCTAIREFHGACTERELVWPWQDPPGFLPPPDDQASA